MDSKRNTPYPKWLLESAFNHRMEGYILALRDEGISVEQAYWKFIERENIDPDDYPYNRMKSKFYSMNKDFMEIRKEMV